MAEASQSAETRTMRNKKLNIEPWYTCKRGGPGEKKPYLSGIGSICDWIQYPFVGDWELERVQGVASLLVPEGCRNSFLDPAEGEYPDMRAGHW